MEERITTAAKPYKDAIVYLEQMARFCQQPVDIRFRPSKSGSYKSNKWIVRVMATDYSDNDFVIAAAQAVKLLLDSHPEKFLN